MEKNIQEKTIGNDLERPKVFLKRNSTKETSFNEEKLGGGRAYDRSQAEMQSSESLMAGASAGFAFGGSEAS
jgi:hypothetical protein